MLVLAHEAGHLKLNAICQANGESPAEPDAQLRAMGINLASPKLNSAAAFQKESAIESFCDACLAQAAITFLGPQWSAPVEALRNHRAARSGALPFFKPDEYATSPALDEVLKRKGKISPEEAALISFESSVQTISSLRKATIAAALFLPELKRNISDRLKQSRQSSKKEDDSPSPPSAPQ